MAIETKHLTANDLRAAANGLSRLYGALRNAEQLRGRKWTERRQEAMDALCPMSWDSADLEEAARVGVDLHSLGFRAQDAIDLMVQEWRG
jgi:hypothetical protein